MPQITMYSTFLQRDSGQFIAKIRVFLGKKMPMQSKTALRFRKGGFVGFVSLIAD